MGLSDIIRRAASVLETPHNMLNQVGQLATRAEQAITQGARDVRDHFTHGNGHVLDNVLRNTGNDVVNIGRNVGGSIGAGIGGGVGALFAGVGAIPGRHLGQSAGRALGREVAANIVDGGTGIIQDIASITPGLSHRGGERHIPNHNTLLERGLGGFAGAVMSPFVRENKPPTAEQLQTRRENSVAISLDNPEATAAHNARLTERRTQQTL